MAPSGWPVTSITTSAMVLMGKVFGNLMVDMQVTCEKLRDRGQRILMEVLGVQRPEAARLLDESGGRVKVGIVMARLGVDAGEAVRRLEAAGGLISRVVGELGPV